MSIFRKDVLTGSWVIMAAGRQRRPDEFATASAPPPDPATCPFCPGREDQTTPAVLTLPAPGGSLDRSWGIRVFPNMFPALSPDLDEVGGQAVAETLFPELPGVGGHEVVAYTPDHEGSLGRLPVAHLALLLRVVRDRARALALADEGAEVAHVLPFCNHGPRAGATLAHPHLQILASPLVPDLIRQKQERLAVHAAENGECLLCRLLATEEAKGQRLILAGDRWVALAPWASRFPYQMLLLPRAHGPRLEDSCDEELAGLAVVLQQVLHRLEHIHPGLSYNVVFQGGPVAGPAARQDFHWHVEILPRLAQQAGFEAGSGFAINSVMPEYAARRLRGEE